MTSNEPVRTLTVRFYEDDSDILEALDRLEEYVIVNVWVKETLRAGLNGREKDLSEAKMRRIVEAAVKSALSSYDFAVSEASGKADIDEVNQSIIDDLVSGMDG